MENYFFIVIHLLVLFSAYGLLRLAGVKLLRISIPSVVFVSFIAYAYIGFLLQYSLHQEQFQGDIDREWMPILFFYSSVSLLLLTLGFFIASWRKNIHPKIVVNNSITKGLGRSGMRVVIGLFLICCFMLLLYIKFLPEIPLMAAVRGDNRAAVYLRITTMTSNVLSGPFKSSHYRVFTFFIMSFLTYLLLAHALVVRTRTSWVLMVIVSCVAFFASIVDTGKGQLMLLILGLFMTYLVALNKKIRLTHVFFVCAVLLVILLITISHFMVVGESSVDEMLAGIITRITMGAIVPAYNCLEIFQNHDFLFGRSFPNPRGILPFEQYNLDVEVWQHINPSAGPDTLYSAPGVFWSELYANFGPVGIFTVPVLLGILFYLVQSKLTKLPNHPAKVAIIVWVSIRFSLISQRGASFLLADTDLFAVLIVAFIILIVDRYKIVVRQP